MIDPILVALSALLLLLGIIGCVAPVLPGPPLSWVGLLLLKFVSTTKDNVSWTAVILLGVFAVLVSFLDNMLPVWGAKKMGGDKKVVWGATIGMIVGFFFGIPGIILGPFAGAFLGGLWSGSRFTNSLKHASGAFIGFIGGLALKFVCVALIAFFFVRAAM